MTTKPPKTDMLDHLPASFKVLAGFAEKKNREATKANQDSAARSTHGILPAGA